MESTLDKFVGDAQSERLAVKPALVSKEAILSNSSFKMAKKPNARQLLQEEKELSFAERQPTSQE